MVREEEKLNVLSFMDLKYIFILNIGHEYEIILNIKQK